MWSIQYFNMADLDFRSTELWDRAVIIGYYLKTQGRIVGLYSLDGFYIELYYDGFNETIMDLRAISLDEAVKYLELDINGF